MNTNFMRPVYVERRQYFSLPRALTKKSARG